jgi:outer membrane protein
MNYKQKGIVLIFLFLVLANPFLFAQEKKLITLDEAIELSLKNSKQLKNSQAKIEEATAALKEAVQKKLPDANVSASYLRLNTANVDLKTKSTGSGGNQNATPKISQAAYGILNASLPIYAGGRVNYGIESSKYLEKAARLDAENEKEEVIQNTIEAFIDLYKTKASVNLVKENLANANQRVADLTNWEKNGLLPRNDLLKAQLQSSNVELSLLDAENNWQLANVVMNLLLGLPEKTELVPDSTIIDQAVTAKTVDEYVQEAYKNRKDAAALNFRKKAAETGVKATKGEYYPSISLTGGYIAADIPKVVTVTNAVNIGVGVSYNIGSLWKTKAKVQQAEARTKQLSISESILNENIRLQVSRAYLNLLSSQKKIQVYAKAVDLANENYRVIKNKFNNSLATTTELLDADVAQLQARLNYVFAKADAVVAYNKVLQASGLEGQNIKK